MAVQSKTIYSSPNGDRWSLARHPETGRVFVRHEANPASGGQISDVEVAEFLARAGHGPEKQELLRLIGTLVDGPSAAQIPGDEMPTTGGTL